MAATADIVFVVDESASTAPFDTAFPGKHGESVQFWLHDMMPKLEEKLVGRGITDNRYAMVGFGGPNGQAPSRAFTFGPSEYFGTVNDAIGAISGFHNAGGSEDGWEGLARAVSLRDANITFRPEAAVQFVMVSDEFRGENPDGSATLIAEETLF
ncbi:MAG: VWA domain-containing protein [Pirellulaceae bacterium]